MSASQNNLNPSATNIFKALELVKSIIPTPFYWMGADGKVLGINELCLEAIGATPEILGRIPYSFYKKEIAEHILNHNTDVIHREEVLSQEEWIVDITTKEKKCLTSTKTTLYDDEGKPIGIVGVSIDITDHKDAEQLGVGIKVNIEEKIKNTFASLAEQNEALMKRFGKLANFSHTPLKSIQLPHEQLTHRQKECLYLILQGFSAKMIAQKLNLSPRTVETHIEAIKIRLGCFRKTEIIEYGLKYISCKST